MWRKASSARRISSWEPPRVKGKPGPSCHMTNEKGRKFFLRVALEPRLVYELPLANARLRMLGATNSGGLDGTGGMDWTGRRVPLGDYADDGLLRAVLAGCHRSR